MKITFKQIDAFRAVISAGSVTAVAEILGTSQPAISRLLSDLEKEIGFQLFYRVGRQLEPTEEAQLLVKEVRQAVSGMKHIAEAAAEIGRFGHARLRIIATPAFSSHLVPDLIASFSKIHPEAMVKFEIGQDDATVEWMVSQSFDFGVSISKPTNPTIDYKLVDETPMFCVVPKSHHLAQRKVIRPRDLAGETFISYMSGTRTRFEIDEIFKSQEVFRNLKYEIRTTNAIRDYEPLKNNN